MSTTRNPHDDATAGDAGRCAECRAELVFLDDARFTFVVVFHHDALGERCSCGSAEPDHGVAAIVVVRDHIPNDPETTAWATGCNRGTCTHHFAVDLDAVERSGVPVFTLIEYPACVGALDALAAAGRA